MRIHAILLAAGAGDRFGGETPKQFLRLAGEYILQRSVRALAAAGIDRLLVVAHPEWLAQTRELIAGTQISVPTMVVSGGVTRNESTWLGLRALEATDEDIVVVHDAVRPLVPVEVIRRALAPVVSGRAEASDTVIPSADTVVVVEDERVVDIPPRARFRRGQTPQVFRVDVLRRAYESAIESGDLGATDDCTLVLRYVPGARVEAVDGDERNLKITTRIDMVLADRMLQMQALAPPAIENATPAHPLAGTRFLVIGGTNGIGRAIAEEAVRHAARAEVDGRSLGLDVRDADAVAERIASAATRLGGLDHVVLTAGLLRIGALVDRTSAELAEIVDVNLVGALNVAHAAYRHLAATRGSLTLFASSSFTRGRASYIAYSASKAAIVNLTQGLADEWSADGIRVNAVSPERTDTPMRRRAFPEEPRDALLDVTTVAVATLRLIQSDLTGQVLDVRRHDPDPPERR